MLLDVLARNWWVFAARGLAAIVFGVLALVWPALTLTILIFLFAVYAIVDGSALLFGIGRPRMQAMRRNWSLAVVGLLGIIAGIVAFVLPGVTALSLLYVVAAWSIVMGIFQIIAAIDMRRQIDNEWWLILGGVLAVLFGAYLAIFPGDGLLTLVWLVGFWAIVFGFLNFMLSWRLRALQSQATAKAA